MFVGRTDALNRLGGLWQKSTPSLVTVRGRRRIGKSTLVSEFARRTADHFISIDGQAPGEGVNNKVQLQSFMEQLSMQTNAPDVTVKNWLQAFSMLANALPKDGRVVVLLDERFGQAAYRSMFPREWGNPQRCRIQTVDSMLSVFWDAEEDPDPEHRQ